MKQASEMGLCGWISWLIGIAAGIVVYVASVEAVTWLPALLLGVALAAFIGLVMSNLICVRATPAEAVHDETMAVVAASDAGTEVDGKAAEDAAQDGAASEATPDYDGDGTLEGENEGTRPEALGAARGGKPDNLKEIKGIGPKMEVMCNQLGFFHFDQIAAWSEDEVAWVDANLKGFRGRVTRDDWVEQAKVLAAGGQTEFSKRVEDGKVYEG